MHNLAIGPYMFEEVKSTFIFSFAHFPGKKYSNHPQVQYVSCIEVLLILVSLLSISANPVFFLQNPGTNM